VHQGSWPDASTDPSLLRTRNFSPGARSLSATLHTHTLACSFSQGLMNSRFAQCINCATGLYQTQPQQQSCLACPAGKYARARVQHGKFCSPCGALTYQSHTGQTSCSKCLRGKVHPPYLFQSDIGSSHSPCPSLLPSLPLLLSPCLSVPAVGRRGPGGRMLGRRAGHGGARRGMEWEGGARRGKEGQGGQGEARREKEGQGGEQGGARRV
jgi:hypothetical protein